MQKVSKSLPETTRLKVGKAMRRLSGEKEKDWEESTHPIHSAAITIGSLASHKMMRPSRPPLEIHFPLGETVRAIMGPSWPIVLHGPIPRS